MRPVTILLRELWCCVFFHVSFFLVISCETAHQPRELRHVDPLVAASPRLLQAVPSTFHSGDLTFKVTRTEKVSSPNL